MCKRISRAGRHARLAFTAGIWYKYRGYHYAGQGDGLLVSIVLPCYNEEEMIPFFFERIRPVMAALEEKTSVELVFADDGSTDRSLALIKAAAAEDSRIRYVSFSRNFGKEAAMCAGLAHARGDQVALLDMDLQDPPEMLLDMYHGIVEEGFDCVALRRVTRDGEPPIRSVFARLFYRAINRVSQTNIVDGAKDSRMMTRQMVDAVLSLPERARFSKGIFSWVGFRTKWLPVENMPRVAGKTKWSFWTLTIYAIEGIVAFSNVPLAIAFIIGLLLCLLAVVFGILLLLPQNQGATRLFVACLLFLVGGVQLLCAGVVGLYLSKVHTESRHRPLYIIREKSEA